MNNEFEVTAAGVIRIGDTANAVTGETAGFSFGVSWGRFGFTGGVLGREEARKMAQYILKKLSECKDTEEEAVSKAYVSLEENK